MAALALALRQDAALSGVASLGTSLHVTAASAAALSAALARVRPQMDADGLHATPGEPNLEDVFIALMRDADDNFGQPAG